MYLHKVINSITVYFIFSVIFATANCDHDEKHDNATIKAMMISRIMDKVSIIAMNSLSNVPDEEKDNVLKQMEHKLKLTAEGLIDGNKYVQVIMEELKHKAFGETENNQNENSEEAHHKMQNNKIELDILQARKRNYDDRINSDKIFDKATKKYIITDIANKINSMAKIYLRDSQTVEDKKQILEKINRRVVEASKRVHVPVSQYEDVKAYTELIPEGFHLLNNRLLGPKPQMGNLKLNNLLDKVNQEHFSEYKTYFFEIWNETLIDPHCHDIVEDICLRAEFLERLSCGNGKNISMEQLCDGVSDCSNEIDESSCIPQGVEKVKKGIALISEIEQSNTSNCLQPIVEGDIFLDQHRFLRDKLKSQLDYLQDITTNISKSTSADVKLDLDIEEDFNSPLTKRIISTISATLSSLSFALKGRFCSPRLEMNNVTRVFIDNTDRDDDDEMNVDEKRIWTPKSCTCKDQFCKSDDCDTRCKQLCQQKYNLNHWECPSVTGETSISLDLICDGKVDCTDETDETSCTTASPVAKFEANDLYDKLLDMMSSKSLSVEYEHSRNKIIAQINVIRQLQKLSTTPNANIDTIKKLRDEYFQTLVNIYEDVIQNSNVNELEQVHNFLSVLNEKMVEALKRTHTGNANLTASVECYCRGGTCGLLQCSRKCIVTCLTEPILVSFPCKANNASVHISAVCNGKKECPNDEDENHCRKELCRIHHFVMLRQNLKKAGLSLKGTALGEVLGDWKAKAMESLTVAENSKRPNRKMLEDTVSGILQDLVKSFVSMEETRKTIPTSILKEFKNMSEVVTQSLKTCEK